MRRLGIILTIMIALSMPEVMSQVSLDSCRAWAQRNYPAIRQYELIRQSADYSISNAARAWIPKVMLSAQATYQSDAANMSEVWSSMGLGDVMSAAGREIPDLYMRKFQGKVQLDIQQTIWDGGKAAADKRSAHTLQRQQEAQSDVDFRILDNRILALYFGSLLLEEQTEQLIMTDSVLRENLKRVKTMFDNNMALPSDVDAVEVELLSLEQKRQQLDASRNAYVEMLSMMVGKDLSSEKLALPAERELRLTADKERPELKLMTAQSENIASQRKTIMSYSMPQFSAFAQGWYGYPSLNMFKAMQSGTWGLSAIVGVRMQWNIGAYYTQRNKLNQLDVSQKQIAVQRDVFLYNQRLDRTRENAEILRLSQALASDERIVELRGNVRRAAENKYENGTITTSELLQKISDESNARSARTMHKIELVKAQYEFENL